MKLLLIEDNADLRETIRESLERERYVAEICDPDTQEEISEADPCIG